MFLVFNCNVPLQTWLQGYFRQKADRLWGSCRVCRGAVYSQDSKDGCSLALSPGMFPLGLWYHGVRSNIGRPHAAAAGCGCNVNSQVTANIYCQTHESTSLYVISEPSLSSPLVEALGYVMLLMFRVIFFHTIIEMEQNPLRFWKTFKSKNIKNQWRSF